MPEGLSPLEVGLLRMSVGYGGRKDARPLSPIEVALLLRRLRDTGMTLAECAKVARLRGSTVGRFLQIVDLPEPVQHLVDWGPKKGTVGFSCAYELARLHSAEDQHAAATAILTDGLDSKEVRQLAQLRERSQQPMAKCVQDVLRMRPTVYKRHVFIGSIDDPKVQAILAALTQAKRNRALMSSVERLNLQVTSGRLGKRFFTLVGDERFGTAMKDYGKARMEYTLRKYIQEALTDVETVG